jgi:hypothetical protein
MEHLLSAVAFAGLIAAQFLAVVFVAHEHRKVRSSDTRTSSADELNKNFWLFRSNTPPRKFPDEEVSQ